MVIKFVKFKTTDHCYPDIDDQCILLYLIKECR